MLLTLHSKSARNLQGLGETAKSITLLTYIVQGFCSCHCQRVISFYESFSPINLSRFNAYQIEFVNEAVRFSAFLSLIAFILSFNLDSV